jgi:hypothetical protein
VSTIALAKTERQREGREVKGEGGSGRERERVREGERGERLGFLLLTGADPWMLLCISAHTQL